VGKKKNETGIKERRRRETEEICVPFVSSQRGNVAVGGSVNAVC
jgi:hypothetical protein